MKTISKEEIEAEAEKSYIKWFANYCGKPYNGFKVGAEWAIQQLQEPPQSVEVMTLEFNEGENIGDYFKRLYPELISQWGKMDKLSISQAMFLAMKHASQIKARADQLEKDIQSTKEFLYGEIIERREYSASKSFEVVLEYIEALQSETK